ncbi:MAG TPA: ABC-F family ATP-binding cassette domain-containing protein [Meiothermus sp.]|nr:ABC-F family ATP-binding cassette domain-containing protein [Meiothermus sp.]
MSVLLRLQDLYFAHEGQPDYLIEGASWELSEGQKVGLLGYNGAGKSTLLQLIQGNLEPEMGLLERNFASLFVLNQEDHAEGGASAQEYLLGADAGLLEMHQSLHTMEQAGLPDPLAYADLSQKFLEAGGYERLHQIERVAVDFGFDPEDLNRPVDSFSGGERRLLKLASAFVQRYDLYLLDEPTNYLDHSASERLVRTLQKSDGTLLMVSHDRWFLDQVASQILELDRKTLRLYGGNYSTFAATKAQEYAEAVRKKEKLEREIAKLKEVERTYKTWGADREADKYRPMEGKKDKGYIGAKAAKLQGRAVQARERVAERIEELEESRPWVEKFYEVRFAPVEPRQGWGLQVQNLSHGFGERQLFWDLSFRLDWGEKVLVAGENGSGKSTLLKILLGQFEPQGGQVFWGSRVRLGYLPQLESGLDEGQGVHQLFPRELHPQARTLLGAFKVSGQAFFRRLGSLSEGQKRKVALVRIILERPNFLILDEPTTHLDYQSVELLEEMLKEFGGTVLFTSHDRYLSQGVAVRKISLALGDEVRATALPAVEGGQGARSAKGRLAEGV